MSESAPTFSLPLEGRVAAQRPGGIDADVLDAVLAPRADTPLWPAGHLPLKGGAIAYGAAPPPPTPPRKGEGNLAAAPRRTNVGNLGQKGGAGVSLPLVGRGQGWGSATIENSICVRPAHKGGDQATHWVSPIFTVAGNAARPRRIISPLEGEMAGRPEGGALRPAQS